MRLNELYETYKDRVEFYLIYIREAHPADGWQVPNNLIEDILYDEPTTDEERTEVASACQINLGIDMPMLVDGIDNDIDDVVFTSTSMLRRWAPTGSQGN